jgi:hypothetical protein
MSAAASVSYPLDQPIMNEVQYSRCSLAAGHLTVRLCDPRPSAASQAEWRLLAGPPQRPPQEVAVKA